LVGEDHTREGTDTTAESTEGRRQTLPPALAQTANLRDSDDAFDARVAAVEMDYGPVVSGDHTALPEEGEPQGTFASCVF